MPDHNPAIAAVAPARSFGETYGFLGPNGAGKSTVGGRARRWRENEVTLAAKSPSVTMAGIVGVSSIPLTLSVNVRP